MYKPIKHICTYFDYNFLPRGLALYHSIKKYHNDFIFYVLAFDIETYNYLISLNYSNIVPISFEDYDKYFNTKQDRFEDRKQYFFSATPNICLYIFDKFPSVDLILYLDADVYAFNSLDSLYHELGEASIAFCSHRLYPLFNILSKNYGRYNVGVNFFRKSDEGIRCLKDWKNDCDSWFPNKPGYPLKFFSDQIFLDNWCEKYNEIKVISNIGVNVAPWNIANYKVTESNNQFFIDNEPLIIYHFSSLKKVGTNTWNGNTIIFFGSISGKLLRVYKEYIGHIESFNLNNSKVVPITHQNSLLKRVFYFVASFILKEKIIVKQ